MKEGKRNQLIWMRPKQWVSWNIKNLNDFSSQIREVAKIDKKNGRDISRTFKILIL